MKICEQAPAFNFRLLHLRCATAAPLGLIAALYLHYFDNKMGASYNRSEIRISILFGFRKTIVDGTIKDSPLRSSLLETERWTIFYCNSHTAILNPQRKEEKRSFSESFLHALLFLEKAGSTA